MSIFKKLLPIAGAALGTAFGMPQVGAALGGAAAGALGHGSQKKQASKNLADYNAAQAGSINALTGARDASLAGYQPFVQGGTQAFQDAGNMLQPGYQFNTNDPLYQFELSQGVDALDRSASARGALNSGGEKKALLRYGQGIGGNAFQQEFNNRNQLAQYGLRGADGVAQTQSGYAHGVNNALFAGADGRSGARTDKGAATASQYGDIAGGVDALFGPGGAFGGAGGSGWASTLAGYFGG